MKKNLYNFFHKTIPLILFLLPFFWNLSGKITSSPEGNFLLDPDLFLEKTLSTWNHSYGFGIPNSSITLLPYAIVTKFFSVLLSIPVIYDILFGITLSCSYLSIKYLLHTFFKDNGVTPIVSILYLSNPFFISSLLWFPSYSTLFILSPLAIALVYKTLLSGFWSKYSLYLSLVLLVSGPIFQNLGLGAIFLICIFSGFIIKILYSKFSTSDLTNFTLITIEFVLLNSYWILPYLLMFQEMYGGTKLYKDISDGISIIHSPISKGFYFSQYYWLDKTSPSGLLHYPYYSWYKIIIQILFPLLFIIALINSLFSKKEKINIFATILILVGIFCGKGYDGFLGNVYRYALVNIKYLGIFRSGDIKFPLFSVLGLILLLGNIKSIKKSLAIFLFISAIVLSTPLYLGSPIESANKFYLPNYWTNIQKNISKDSGRILLFPENNTPFDKFGWGYEGSWLTSNISASPSIGRTDGYGGSYQENNFVLTKDIYSLVNEGKLKNVIAEYNISTLLFRNDLVNSASSSSILTNINSKIIGPNFIDTFTSEETPGYITGDNVKYYQESSSKYYVQIHTDDSIRIKFLESFSKNWKIYQTNLSLSSCSIRHLSSIECLAKENGKEHIEEIKNVNHSKGKYENIYEIKNHYSLDNTENKNIDLVIEYIPQRLFNTGIKISLITILIIIFYHAIIKRKLT